jgi:hypothetical protein
MISRNPPSAHSDINRQLKRLVELADLDERREVARRLVIGTSLLKWEFEAAEKPGK